MNRHTKAPTTHSADYQNSMTDKQIYGKSENGADASYDDILQDRS